MPDARLQRTRETYQGVPRCSECGRYGHSWCGLVDMHRAECRIEHPPHVCTCSGVYSEPQPA